MTSINLSLDRIRSITMLALTRNGFSDKQARAVADVVTRAEADGCQSHGLYRVPGYVAAVRSGRANGAAEPRVNMRAPGVIYVDGDRGFAPAAFEAARTALISAARQNGIAALACGNTHHFSALWADLEPLIAADLVAWCYVVGQCAVAPHGGVRRLLGTNPVAFGCRDPKGVHSSSILRQAPPRAVRSNCGTRRANGSPRDGPSTAKGTRPCMPEAPWAARFCRSAVTRVRPCR
ncbi:hypothetical protein ShzoTeo12_03910 [Shinella zoogloeoides]|nr:hypothetical protein ShzoTeo12_03910 [Shinella zoogloeoides]